jgi:hypothetical protein
MKLKKWASRRKLKKLMADRAKYDRSWRKDLDAARKAKKTHDEIEGIKSQWEMEDRMCADEIDAFITSELRLEARDFFVTLPSRDDDNGIYWESSNFDESRFVLTRAGMLKVSDAIREQELKRWDLTKVKVEFWSKIITTCGVIIGVATALPRCWTPEPKSSMGAPNKIDAQK